MCIFCKIVKGEIPSNRVLENSDFLAIHDINPSAPIHLLVIPKKHIECFQDISGELMEKATPFIQEITRELGLDKTGYRLVVNNGSDGGQEVMHLHFHILGGGKLKWSHYSNNTKKSL